MPLSKNGRRESNHTSIDLRLSKDLQHVMEVKHVFNLDEDFRVQTAEGNATVSHNTRATSGMPLRQSN